MVLFFEALTNYYRHVVHLTSKAMITWLQSIHPVDIDGIHISAGSPGPPPPIALP